MPASNHRCVGELLPPVGAVHGLWGTENGLQEVLVDLQQKRGGGGGRGGRAGEEEGDGMVLSSSHLQIQQQVKHAVGSMDC